MWSNVSDELAASIFTVTGLDVGKYLSDLDEEIVCGNFVRTVTNRSYGKERRDREGVSNLPTTSYTKAVFSHFENGGRTYVRNVGTYFTRCNSPEYCHQLALQNDINVKLKGNSSIIWSS
jgi:hypothetical protein